MVEVIKNTISRMEPRKANNNNAVPKEAVKSTSSAPNADSVELKSIDKMSVIKEMAAAAPIDQANVNRIKDAIKRGEYPINIDLISEALLEAYREMKS